MKRFLLAMLCIILLSGCKHKIERGVVVEKEYHPSWVLLQPNIVGKTTVLIPIIMPETWEVVVEDNGVTESFDIQRADFEKINVGDSIHLTVEKKKK